MKLQLPFSPSVYRARLRRLKSLLTKEPRATALLVESAPEVVKSADAHFDYAPDSNLMYLTGWMHQGVALLASSELKRPVLFCTPTNPDRVKWQGALPSVSALARMIDADVVETESRLVEIQRKLAKIELLLCHPRAGTLSAELVKGFCETPPSFRRAGPRLIGDVEVVLATLRVVKEPAEVAFIEQAADITSVAFAIGLPLLERRATEQQIAEKMEHEMRMGGGGVAFHSIIAAGKNAAILHHSPTDARPAPGELVLFDFGASKHHYAADVSRTVSFGAVSSRLRDLYDIVLAAEVAAIRAVKPGVRFPAVSAVAERILCEGLVSLGVLKGRVPALLKKRAHKKYFSHSIGHSLGLDTHDMQPRTDERGLLLEEGMVITIEPGLYFPEKFRGLPACGVRIEDDVLVTKQGRRVLTECVPKALF